MWTTPRLDLLLLLTLYTFYVHDRVGCPVVRGSSDNVGDGLKEC